VECGYTCFGGTATSKHVCNPTCGDAIRAGNEVCDDGNTVSADGCSADCLAVEIEFFSQITRVSSGLEGVKKHLMQLQQDRAGAVSILARMPTTVGAIQAWLSSSGILYIKTLGQMQENIHNLFVQHHRNSESLIAVINFICCC
jgi:cysteine-rich repeat protein